MALKLSHAAIQIVIRFQFNSQQNKHLLDIFSKPLLKHNSLEIPWINYGSWIMNRVI